jgi:hypothetical protein
MADERVARFRALINDFKLPYIRRLEMKENTEEETQDLEKINRIVGQLDTLYEIIKAAILNGGQNQKPDEIARAVCAVFERNGNFNDLRHSPELKDEFLRVLRLDLKTYPLTVNRQLIDIFEKKHVPSYQAQPAQLGE